MERMEIRNDKEKLKRFEHKNSVTLDKQTVYANKPSK